MNKKKSLYIYISRIYESGDYFFMNNDKLNELVKRMNGDLMVAVLGSTRSGKSTFVSKFMELKILPHIKDDFLKNKILDELPQTAEGKQIMTVEPKFIPSQQINVDIDDVMVNIKFVDSVGYVLSNSIGYKNEDGPRYVKTPWYDEEIEFKEAAKIGTKKIMENHSNLGIVITSDGSFGEFKRSDYEEVEASLINEMKELEKPFVVVLNTKDPYSTESELLVNKLKEEYEVEVCACNIKNITEADIDQIISLALMEFPIAELNMSLPSFMYELGEDIKMRKEITNIIDKTSNEFRKIKEVEKIVASLKMYEYFEDVKIELEDVSVGKVNIDIKLKEEALKMLLNELVGKEVATKDDLIVALYNGHKALSLYNELGPALNQCKELGYGVAIPNLNDMKLLPPSIIKQAGRYGVKVSAVAPSIHLIKVDVESSFSPIIGSLEQSKVLIDSLENEDDSEIWNKEIFGRRLSEIVNDGIKQKIYALPDASKEKLKDVLSKLINSNRNSLIAIIL